MSTKPTASNREIEAAFSSLFEVITEETAPLVLNHLELSRRAVLAVMQQQAVEYAPVIGMATTSRMRVDIRAGAAIQAASALAARNCRWRCRA